MTIEKALLIQQLDGWQYKLRIVTGYANLTPLDSLEEKHLDTLNSLEMDMENLLNLLKND